MKRKPRKAVPIESGWTIGVDNVSEEMRPTVDAMLGKWRRLIAQLAHPDVELQPEELAPVLATWAHLRRSGVRFDPLLDVLLGKLRDQMFGTDADPDFDMTDDLLDLEDSDEDGRDDDHTYMQYGPMEGGGK